MRISNSLEQDTQWPNLFSSLILLALPVKCQTDIHKRACLCIIHLPLVTAYIILWAIENTSFAIKQFLYPFNNKKCKRKCDPIIFRTLPWEWVGGGAISLLTASIVHHKYLTPPCKPRFSEGAKRKGTSMAWLCLISFEYIRLLPSRLPEHDFFTKFSYTFVFSMFYSLDYNTLDGWCFSLNS